MFRFKQFTIDDAECGMKLSTDSVLLGAWTNIDDCRSIIDLGCGSGILSLMCAQRNPKAEIQAIDISEEAVAATTANAQASPWSQRINAAVADALSFQPTLAVDLIICNPPYFTSKLVSPDALRATARHGAGLQPLTALDCARRWLAPQGRISMITPADNSQDIIFHAELNRLRLRRKCLVTSVTGKSPSRILWEFSPQDGPIETSAIDIRLSTGEYSPAYIFLTSPFYLNF